MTERSSKSLIGSQRIAFILVFLAVTGFLTGGGLWVMNFVLSRAEVEAPVRTTSPIYVNYDTDTAKYLKSESLVGMGVWIQANPNPVNVQVLKGMSTTAIAGYMVYGVAAGLQVDCSHCHNVQNFAQEEMADPAVTARKAKAREHLKMMADLNQNWLTQLATLSPDKKPSGAQIACATCHLGVALPKTWPDEMAALPDDLRLPLEDPTILQITAKKDISLDTVQYNQHVMYYMNTSLGVGCTHCHNSRYFPSFERPSKYYAQHMLNMAQYMKQTYAETLNNQDPSCNMCHYGNIIPPGAARTAADIPAILSSDPTGAMQQSAQAATGAMP